MAEAGERRFGQGLFRFSGEVFPARRADRRSAAPVRVLFLLPVSSGKVLLLERWTALMLKYKTATTEILKNRREPE